MLLTILIKILFWLLAIRYSIAAVSYGVSRKAKKTNHRGGGNWRMPKEVVLALTEGYKIKVYPKNLQIYPAVEEIKDDASSVQFTHPSNKNFTLAHLFREKLNRKRKLFPLLKTGSTTFIHYSKLHTTLKTLAKNNIVSSEILFNTKFTNLTNSKNSAVLNLSPENSFACRQ